MRKSYSKLSNFLNVAIQISRDQRWGEGGGVGKQKAHSHSQGGRGVWKWAIFAHAILEQPLMLGVLRYKMPYRPLNLQSFGHNLNSSSNQKTSFMKVVKLCVLKKEMLSIK